MKGLFQKRLEPIACEYIDMFLTFFSILFKVPWFWNSLFHLFMILE